MIDLLKIEGPEFLKDLKIDELNELSQEVRSFIIDKVSKTGGHLSSNLGVVELTIAVHKVFSSPKDKIIFDVGHQAYTHKILTGRAKDFDKLRKLDGLSGYLKREESIHDVWEAGHSSTAIAALAGFEYAKSMDHLSHKVVAVVGDGSLNSGLSFEALNFLGHKPGLSPIIILNDNEMSISKNVGTLAKLLNSMRSSKPYVKATKSGRKFPKIFHELKVRIGNMLRGFAKNMTIFDEFGLQYYGPIDGHDFKTLLKYLTLVKNSKQPCVLHVITKKGKGYSPAENDVEGSWHGVSSFDIQTGLPLVKNKENLHSWSNIISDYILKYTKTHKDFRIIIPAMINGSGLREVQHQFPNQIIDVGICESFAVCFSGALAINNKQVFVPIYSSFLQRAYDQVSHDVARQDLHVVFGIDRSGLVGDDGETHQGIYDIAYLRHIPNMEIIQPKDPIEAFQLLDYAFNVSSHPVAIRYSRSKLVFEFQDHYTYSEIKYPSWEQLTFDGTINLITYGDNVLRMKQLIESEKLSINLYNARFIKPMDEKILISILSNELPIFVLEDVTVVSGLGSAILEYAQSKNLLCNQLSILGLPDQFIEQGSLEELYLKYELDNITLIKLFKKNSQK
ncbi:MAG: 1-deoxy-D-xylulose-5-phosphate synthase [Firmicutes bacterium]|nr:1-deoxy-D-xylulose-5-phosphate synthase [Bacillota bacterium]